MNKRYLPLLLIVMFALAALALTWNNGTVHAQGGCTDATGRPIPCPGQEDNKKTPTPVPPQATATFTPTATAIATNTPLPLEDSTGNSSTDIKVKSCKGGDLNWRLNCAFRGAEDCANAGGTSTGSSSGNTIEVTCSVDAWLIIEPTPLSIVNPTDNGATEGKKSVFCTDAGDGIYGQLCAWGNIQTCLKAGGEASETWGDGGVKVTCSKPVFVTIEPTPLPLAIPANDDNWIGRCTEADAVNGSLEDCFNRFTCEDGTLVTKVDLYSGEGTVYDFYCIPHKPTFPPGGWLPWIAGLGGLIVGLWLPAIQKVRSASSRGGRLPNNKNPELMRNKDGDESTEASARGGGAGKPTYSDMNVKIDEPRNEGTMPQTREHVLLSNQPSQPPEAGLPLSVSHGGTGSTNAKKPGTSRK